MESGYFGILVFIVFLVVVFVVGYILLVPIKYEQWCIRFCKSEGYVDGFCREASLEGNEIVTIELQENAVVSDAQCLLNPIALSMKELPRCFCRKS